MLIKSLYIFFLNRTEQRASFLLLEGSDYSLLLYSLMATLSESLRSPYLLFTTFFLLSLLLLFFSPLFQQNPFALNYFSSSTTTTTSTTITLPSTLPQTNLVSPAPAPAPALTQYHQPYLQPKPTNRVCTIFHYMYYSLFLMLFAFLGFSLFIYFEQNKSNTERIEEDLARARAAIRKAIVTKNFTSDRNEIYIPRGSVYRNPYAFHQLSNLLFFTAFNGKSYQFCC